MDTFVDSSGLHRKVLIEKKIVQKINNATIVLQITN